MRKFISWITLLAYCNLALSPVFASFNGIELTQDQFRAAYHQNSISINGGTLTYDEEHGFKLESSSTLPFRIHTELELPSLDVDIKSDFLIDKEFKVNVLKVKTSGAFEVFGDVVTDFTILECAEFIKGADFGFTATKFFQATTEDLTLEGPLAFGGQAFITSQTGNLSNAVIKCDQAFFNFVYDPVIPNSTSFEVANILSIETPSNLLFRASITENTELSSDYLDTHKAMICLRAGLKLDQQGMIAVNQLNIFLVAATYGELNGYTRCGCLETNYTYVAASDALLNGEHQGRNLDVQAEIARLSGKRKMTDYFMVHVSETVRQERTDQSTANTAIITGKDVFIDGQNKGTALNVDSAGALGVGNNFSMDERLLLKASDRLTYQAKVDTPEDVFIEAGTLDTTANSHLVGSKLYTKLTKAEQKGRVKKRKAWWRRALSLLLSKFSRLSSMSFDDYIFKSPNGSIMRGTFGGKDELLIDAAGDVLLDGVRLIAGSNLDIYVDQALLIRNSVMNGDTVSMAAPLLMRTNSSIHGRRNDNSYVCFEYGNTDVGPAGRQNSLLNLQFLNVLGAFHYQAIDFVSRVRHSKKSIWRTTTEELNHSLKWFLTNQGPKRAKQAFMLLGSMYLAGLVKTAYTTWTTYSVLSSFMTSGINLWYVLRSEKGPDDKRLSRRVIVTGNTLDFLYSALQMVNLSWNLATDIKGLYSGDAPIDDDIKDRTKTDTTVHKKVKKKKKRKWKQHFKKWFRKTKKKKDTPETKDKPNPVEMGYWESWGNFLYHRGLTSNFAGFGSWEQFFKNLASACVASGDLGHTQNSLLNISLANVFNGMSIQERSLLRLSANGVIAAQNTHHNYFGVLDHDSLLAMNSSVYSFGYGIVGGLRVGALSNSFEARQGVLVSPLTVLGGHAVALITKKHNPLTFLTKPMILGRTLHISGSGLGDLLSLIEQRDFYSGLHVSSFLSVTTTGDLVVDQTTTSASTSLHVETDTVEVKQGESSQNKTEFTASGMMSVVSAEGDMRLGANTVTGGMGGTSIKVNGKLVTEHLDERTNWASALILGGYGITYQHVCEITGRISNRYMGVMIDAEEFLGEGCSFATPGDVVVIVPKGFLNKGYSKMITVKKHGKKSKKKPVFCEGTYQIGGRLIIISQDGKITFQGGNFALGEGAKLYSKGDIEFLLIKGHSRSTKPGALGIGKRVKKRDDHKPAIILNGHKTAEKDEEDSDPKEDDKKDDDAPLDGRNVFSAVSKDGDVLFQGTAYVGKNDHLLLKGIKVILKNKRMASRAFQSGAMHWFNAGIFDVWKSLNALEQIGDLKDQYMGDSDGNPFFSLLDPTLTAGAGIGFSYTYQERATPGSITGYMLTVIAQEEFRQKGYPVRVKRAFVKAPRWIQKALKLRGRSVQIKQGVQVRAGAQRGQADADVEIGGELQYSQSTTHMLGSFETDEGTFYVHYLNQHGGLLVVTDSAFGWIDEIRSKEVYNTFFSAGIGGWLGLSGRLRFASPLNFRREAAGSGVKIGDGSGLIIGDADMKRGAAWDVNNPNPDNGTIKTSRQQWPISINGHLSYSQQLSDGYDIVDLMRGDGGKTLRQGNGHKPQQPPTVSASGGATVNSWGLSYVHTWTLGGSTAVHNAGTNNLFQTVPGVRLITPWGSLPLPYGINTQACQELADHLRSTCARLPRFTNLSAPDGQPDDLEAPVDPEPNDEYLPHAILRIAIENGWVDSPITEDVDQDGREASTTLPEHRTQSSEQIEANGLMQDYHTHIEPTSEDDLSADPSNIDAAERVTESEDAIRLTSLLMSLAGQLSHEQYLDRTPLESFLGENGESLSYTPSIGSPFASSSEVISFSENLIPVRKPFVMNKYGPGRNLGASLEINFNIPGTNIYQANANPLPPKKFLEACRLLQNHPKPEIRNLGFLLQRGELAIFLADEGVLDCAAKIIPNADFPPISTNVGQQNGIRYVMAITMDPKDGVHELAKIISHEAEHFFWGISTGRMTPAVRDNRLLSAFFKDAAISEQTICRTGFGSMCATEAFVCSPPNYFVEAFAELTYGRMLSDIEKTRLLAEFVHAGENNVPFLNVHAPIAIRRSSKDPVRLTDQAYRRIFQFSIPEVDGSLHNNVTFKGGSTTNSLKLWELIPIRSEAGNAASHFQATPQTASKQFPSMTALESGYQVGMTEFYSELPTFLCETRFDLCSRSVGIRTSRELQTIWNATVLPGYRHQVLHPPIINSSGKHIYISGHANDIGFSQTPNHGRQKYLSFTADGLFYGVAGFRTMNNLLSDMPPQQAFGHAFADTRTEFYLFDKGIGLISRQFGPWVATGYIAGGLGSYVIPDYSSLDLTAAWQNPNGTWLSNSAHTAGIGALMGTKYFFNALPYVATQVLESPVGNIMRLGGEIAFNPEIATISTHPAIGLPYWYFYRTGQMLQARPDIPYSMSPAAQGYVNQSDYNSMGFISKVIMNQAVDDISPAAWQMIRQHRTAQYIQNHQQLMQSMHDLMRVYNSSTGEITRRFAL